MNTTISSDYTASSAKSVSSGRTLSKSSGTGNPTGEAAVSSGYTAAAVAELSMNEKDKDKKDKEAEYYDRLLKNYKEQLQSIRRAFQKKKNVSYDALADLNALAGAETIGQVKRLKSRLTMKASLILKSGGEEEAIKAALIRIKRVLGKASAKIRHLTKESQIDKKQKLAEQELDKKLAEKLDRILNARRRNRKAAERNDIIEAAKGRGVNLVTPQDIKSFPIYVPSLQPEPEPVILEEAVSNTAVASPVDGSFSDVL